VWPAWVARQGHARCVGVLLGRGADALARDARSLSALHLASASNRPEVVSGARRRPRRRSTLGAEVVWLVMPHRRRWQVRVLLSDQGAATAAAAAAVGGGGAGATAEGEEARRAELLMRARDDFLDTPVVSAVRQGHADIVEQLVAAGWDAVRCCGGGLGG
jgi:hypothetical protein